MPSPTPGVIKNFILATWYDKMIFIVFCFKTFGYEWGWNYYVYWLFFSYKSSSYPLLIFVNWAPEFSLLVCTDPLYLALFRNTDHVHEHQTALALQAIFSGIALAHVHQKTWTRMFRTDLCQIFINRSMDKSDVTNPHNGILNSNEKN